MSEENQGGLSAAEEAYFSSAGNAPLEGEAQPKVEAVTAEVQPEQKTAEQQQQERDEKGRFIPHSVFHAEREEHKRTKAELAELRQFRAVMEDRWNTLLKASQPKEEPQAPPDPNEDIFAFSKWQADQVKALQAKIAEREQAETQARQQTEAEQQIWNTWREDAQAYSQEKADFGDAAGYLAELRDKQLSGLARVHPQFATKQGRDAQINAELAAIVTAAKQHGVRPAEAVYEMASAWGYQPKQANPANIELPENLKRVAAAQEQSRTVGNGGGKAGGGEMDLGAVLAMPPAEFDAWYKVPANARLFDKLMGG